MRPLSRIGGRNTPRTKSTPEHNDTDVTQWASSQAQKRPSRWSPSYRTSAPNGQEDTPFPISSSARCHLVQAAGDSVGGEAYLD